MEKLANVDILEALLAGAGLANYFAGVFMSFAMLIACRRLSGAGEHLHVDTVRALWGAQIVAAGLLFHQSFWLVRRLYLFIDPEISALISQNAWLVSSAYALMSYGGMIVWSVTKGRHGHVYLNQILLILAVYTGCVLLTLPL